MCLNKEGKDMEEHEAEAEVGCFEPEHFGLGCEVVDHAA